MVYFVPLVALILVLTLSVLIRKLLQRRRKPPVSAVVPETPISIDEEAMRAAAQPTEDLAVAGPSTTVVHAESQKKTRYFKATLISLVVLIPVCVIGLYLLIGSPQHLDATAIQTATDSSQPDVEDLINRLVTHLEANPDNAEGWFILGRTYLKLGRYNAAVRALTTAHEQNPAANTKVALADVLTLQNQGQVPELAIILLEQALELAPDSATTLWLLGQAAKQQGQTAQAQDYWQRTLPLLQDQPEARAALQAQLDGLAATVDEAGILVQVSLDPTLQTQADAAAVVYVYAKADSGPPLAVSKHTVADLPLTIQLDDSQAMMPQHKLSQHIQVLVGARISQSGQAIAQSGDLISTEVAVRAAQQTNPVALVINQKKP
ncbi:MAG: tetratricopeptide repeat protein [Pseudomonadota bacterium]